MSSVIRGFLSMLLAIALAAGAGCGRVSTQEAVHFNDALVASQKRLYEAGVKFGDAAGKALGGGPAEAVLLDRALENAKEEMARARADVRNLAVPKSDSARAFHAAFTRMLDTEEKLLADELGAIAATLKDSSRSPDAKRKRVLLIANYLQKVEQDALATVKTAQAEFAKAHGFQVR